ncbi:PREDICTED: putative diacyglycerol O-acyltransferase MT1468 [Acropora digitifera]|uniref:putative diacyglycerol O-acyltransferase MT1468 n=1 Tax=Acropora digitifera TaxID=70779 RepID=UPI000779FA1B|nr:PREDICTED: putative diacyglycerol O-acyltransferase MT1468 [Acropora digitifera]
MDTKENFSVEKNHIKCDSPQQITTNCSIHPSIGSSTSSTREPKIRMEMIYSFLSTSLFVIECLLCYAILLVVLIPLFPFIVTFYMLKMAERVIVKATSGELHLPGMDAVHATDEEANRHDIKALLCFENRGNIEERINAIRRSVLDRMVNATNDTGELLFPRTRCHIRPGWFQYFFQEDQSFEIENHVFKWEGDVPRSKDELTAIISKLSNVSLPEGRSPWYFCCIPTNFGDNDLAVLFKMNHTVADGISLVRFLTQKLTDTTNIPPLTSQSKKFNESPTRRRLLLAKAALITPRYLFQLMLSFADRSILHGPNLSGVKKVAWHEAFELKLIKDIKTATGTTVNDVLMSCLSLALRRYFQRKGVENPDDFTASVAVNVRSSASSKELSFENKFSLVFLKLAVATDGPLKQLYETKDRMDKSKVSAEPLASAFIIHLTQELLPEFLISKVNTFVVSKASCVFSNLPGPQFTLTVSGTNIKYLLFWPPQTRNIGVGLSILSYAGQVIVGVQGDVSVLSDPEAIVEEFGSAVQELARCVLRVQ